MPRVPVYDEQQVQQAPIAGVKQQGLPDTGLTGLGNAVSNIGTVLDKRAQQMQEEDDAAQLTEVFAAASDKLRPVMRDDILARQGKEAFGAYQDADKVMAEIAKEAEGSLRSDQQRDAFRRMWLSQRSGNLNAVASHVAAQRQTYRQNMAKVGAQAALEDAAAAWNNPEAANAAMQRGAAMIRANLHGQAPEVITEQVQAYESSVHAAKIERMAIANPMGAKAYYLENKDKINGLTQGKIEKLLDSEVLRTESQAAADRIAGSGKSLEEQLADARKLRDPKLRDETVRRVKDRYNESKAVASAYKTSLIEDAGKIIVNGGSLDDLRPEHREALGVSGMSSINSYIKNRTAGVSAPKYTDRYFALQDMATREPDKFAELPLIQEMGRIAPSQLAELQKLQRSVKKGDSKDLTFGRTWNQIAMDALPQGTKTNDDLAKGFRRWVEEQMRVEGVDKETPDWRDKVQAIVDRGMIEGVIKDGGFAWLDKKVYGFQAPAEQELPTPQTQQEFDSLPSGAFYKDPDDGRTYRKP